MKNAIRDKWNPGTENSAGAGHIPTNYRVFVNYSFQIFGAFIILALGVLVARKISDIVLKLCDRKKLDVTLSRLSALQKLPLSPRWRLSRSASSESVSPRLLRPSALSLGTGLVMQELLVNYGNRFTLSSPGRLSWGYRSLAATRNTNSWVGISTEMKKIILLLSITIFSWLGWWLGDHIGMMTAYLISFVGSLVGVYVGVRISRDYLD